MEATKYEVGEILSLEVAANLYKNHGICNIVTDGIYIQLEKETDHE